MLRRNYASFDFLLVFAVLALGIFGIIMIGSAVYTTGSSTSHTLQKIWFAMGVVLMLAAAFVDYHYICSFYIVIYAINILLLIIVLLVGSGDGDDPARWIRFGTTGIGARIGIQPSEFSKIFMILFLSKLIDAKKDYINSFSMLLIIIVSSATPIILIQRQPSLSATLVVAAITVTIVFVGGLYYRFILPVVTLVIPCAALFYVDLTRTPHMFVDKILPSYQLKRIMDFLYPNPNSPTAYHTGRSISAIGSGMLHGKGLYNGVVNIPAAHNDFIFAVIGEEFGYVGCIAVMCAMLFIIFKCILIAHKAPDFLGKLIASGVAGMLAFQTFAHIGVNIGLLPNTGVPLPFVSYGGSSMWISMMSIGLVLNVAMTRQKSIFEV